MKIAHLDFETRSRVDLTEVGAFRYAVDPSTEILMAGVSDHDSAEVRLWVNPKFGAGDDDALDILRSADLIYAHNAPFEMAMQWGKGLPGVRIQTHQWRCTAAMARKAALPSSLEKCAEALKLDAQKDKEGKRLIKLFSIECADPKDHPADWEKFKEYCRQDVRVEKAIHRKLVAFELSGGALETFLFDLRMNLRGIPVNVPALTTANGILDTAQAGIVTEFRALTGLNPTQREKVRQIVNLPNMQAETVEEALGDPLLDERQHTILKLYSQLSYAAVKKIPTMLDWACPDQRMRGVQKYYGAGTGRWSAGGPQIHNAKKATAEMRLLTDLAYADICKGCDAEYLNLLYGDPVEVLASSIRHFVHAPGREMLDGDYNAIEGRIACWRAGQMDILNDWRESRDLYKRATAFVEGIPESQVSRDGRAFGKVVELACQFGLGVDGFIRTCAKWGITCDEKKAHRAVYEYYRPTHERVVSRWYFLDDCMREAIAVPGVPSGSFVVRQLAGMKYLLLTLPSGRALAYPDPQITRRPPTPKEVLAMREGKVYNEKRFLEISYWGEIKPNVWGRVKLHGAKAFENEVQAIAADVMAHGAINAERLGMAPFALIHDQALALRENGHTAEDFAAALADLPKWATGLPVKVEAKICNYYAK